MKGNDIRKAYLDFFESKGHLAMESFSLIPENDPSLLLIGAGMAPLKPFFTGKLVPPNPRVTTCQKCIRTGDIENVGRTARHQTFFEMLGNFSFGDYFKKEAIQWAWEFLTEVIHLDKDRLYVTIYPDDTEAYETWRACGVEDSHISRLEDNFWEIGEGPCGPDSEIFYDLGEERGCHDEHCAPGCDCDRYLEIWNLVFTQFNKMPDGSYEPLAKKNIDTGAGLERLASVLQGKDNNFETDLIFPIIEKTQEIANVKYGQTAEGDVSLKVIADHIRAITCLIADGVLPSNEGRGYVLRRTLRRAVRHGRLIGITKVFLTDLVDVVIDILGPGISGLTERKEFIKRVVLNEEERFNQTLAQGLALLQELMDTQKDATVIAGTDVFRLYDTYGFPMELTAEIAHEAGFTLDEEGFKAAMEEQRTRAREAREAEDAKVETPDITFLADVEMGEDPAVTSSEILLIGKGSEKVEEGHDGDTVTLIFRDTPFHAEGGGQLGDTGLVETPMGKIQIETTKKLPEGTIYHIGTIVEGLVKTGDTATFTVDTERRDAMAKNHTATHLLHAALRKVLGDHVTQAGSLVMPDRLRFDFTHFSPMTEEEIATVEAMVNEEILRAASLEIAEMSIEEAKAKGAMALFGEKYGDVVRVVSVPEFSTELCGGTHVTNTAVIGTFRILSEAGIGSGIRRVEAITGRTALEYSLQDRAIIKESASMLKARPEELCDKVKQLQAELKEAEKALAALQQAQAQAAASSFVDGKESINGIDMIAAKFDGSDVDAMRQQADILCDTLGEGIVLLAMAHGDKVNFVCKATKGAIAAGAHAGQIVKAAAQMAGGNGGGRPDMAQAGGKDASKVGDAISAAVDKAKELLA